MSQNRHAKSGALGGLHNPGYSLTGALALGIGLAAPATGHAAPCGPLPFTVSNGFCTLDVNGDAVDDIVLQAGSTFGDLKGGPSLATEFLVSSSSSALLQLSPGDHVGAAIFAANSAENFGVVYGGPGLWDQIGETAFAGFRIAAGTPGDFNYGWIELERGSLIATEWVFVETLNADAVIPEPGSLLLVAIGAAGIAALRRRRASAAEAAH